MAQRFQAPFAFGDAEALRAVITGARLRDVEVRAAVVMRHLLAPEVSIPGLLASTPVGPAVAALTAYRDRDGLTVPQATHIALARK